MLSHWPGDPEANENQRQPFAVLTLNPLYTYGISILRVIQYCAHIRTAHEF